MYNKVIASVHLGDPMAFGPLSVRPIFSDPQSLGLSTLSAALRNNIAQVEELSDSGVVGCLRVRNLGPKALFILDGESVIGGKQNRTFNTSLIVLAGETVLAPVSCLERGRWAARPANFAPAGHVHFADGRKNRIRTVSSSLSTRGDFASDQGEVWSGVRNRLSAASASSSSEAEADYAASRMTVVDKMLAGITAAPGQTGAAFLRGDVLIGLELFGDPDLFSELLPMAARSYALEALEPTLADPPCLFTTQNMLNELLRKPTSRHAAPGGGEALRWSEGPLEAAGLQFGDRLVHLVAFADV